MSRLWLRMLDRDPGAGGGAIPIRPNEAKSWNATGYGIFWTVNAFRDGVRRISHLNRVLAWAIDLDAKNGPKPELFERLKRGPLLPSLIVETKSGFHAYWFAKDGKPEHWNALVLERLVPYYGSDTNARDLARILRVPGFEHLKDPSQPFRVREVFACDVAYTEAQLAKRYPWVSSKPKEEPAAIVRRETREQRESSGDDFWDAAGKLDCHEALQRLSGHALVGGEQFTFKRNRSGTLNILVDGKGTSCWVDSNGRIGSSDHGGPTIIQWLRWYRNEYPEIAKALKELYPELERKR